MPRTRLQGAGTSAAALAATAAGAYGLLTLFAYARYGKVAARDPADRDELLDRYLPAYDVYEHHSVVVRASPEVTLDAAANQDLMRSPMVRAIFRMREIVMGARSDTRVYPRGLLAQTLALGWRVIAEVPGREIVVAAVTRPWEADVVFRGLSGEEFATFHEPGWVKIAWTLRAEPLPHGRLTRFTTETRAVATDDEARRRFRRYWALASPGIWTIRRLSLPSVRCAAERATRFGPSPRSCEPVSVPAP